MSSHALTVSPKAAPLPAAMSFSDMMQMGDALVRTGFFSFSRRSRSFGETPTRTWRNSVRSASPCRRILPRVYSNVWLATPLKFIPMIARRRGLERREGRPALEMSDDWETERAYLTTKARLPTSDKYELQTTCCLIVLTSECY
jgi:hypothetical protein